jgi:hypothetical protein
MDKKLIGNTLDTLRRSKKQRSFPTKIEKSERVKSRRSTRGRVEDRLNYPLG